MTDKPLFQMNSEEFEAYLKTNKITGMAAANAGRKRRAAIKAAGVDPDAPVSFHPDPLPDDYRFTEVTPPGRKPDIPQPEYIDVGPKNFTQAMGLFEVIILDAERKGRQEIMEEIRRMGRIADKLGPALMLLKECRKFTSNASRLVDPAEYDGEHSVYTDPLTIKLEAFFKECKDL